jgi:sarcosine oxidase subunit gamma
MPKHNLVAHSVIQENLRPGRRGAAELPAGVTLALKENLALAMVMARKNRADDLSRCVRAGFDFNLPALPLRVNSGTISCAWAGAGQWLFIGENEDPFSFESTIREKLTGLAAVTNQSDGRTVIRASGPRLRAMLAKGVPIDLHARSFKSGDVAMTVIGHIAVHLSLLNEASTCELVVFRSYASSLWNWLVDAGAEFGVEVVGARL